ncbi:UDPGP type 1 family protein [bacterium 1xD8-6]|nr:UDPGP type 1 family protein [bacterium D16-36]RKI68098.1 UDPGP type 1 family protein [bacterium 1xD8-6]
MNLEEARQKLEKYNQGHLLKYYSTLPEAEQAALLQQISKTDLSVVTRIGKKEAAKKESSISPIAAMTLDEINTGREAFTETGTEAIRSGKVGAVLLAGGMGTRLGSDNPKGMYDIGITKPVYIFQRIVDNLFDIVDKTRTWIHLFIMTSDKNHEITQKFFEEQQYFGYDKEHIHFFRQDMAPASDYEGKILLESKGKLATSPNGNGGWFSSLTNAGLLGFMKQEGIEWLNVFAVDNVLQRIADPCFIGAVIERNCEAGAKVVRKNHPDEKVGVMCLEDGHPSIIEYYELTDSLRDTMTEDGEPAYNFGVILNYLFRIDSLEKVVNKELPLHIVEKKIPCLNEQGEFIQPEEPNGYKFETLILDLIKLLDSCLPFEVERSEEFAPIKNKTGIDSVESAQLLLKQNGIEL